MEIDQLFETLTIKELKQQNIKTKTEIESKKEEIRFLVSERYRDIIDAADTIFEMKTCSDEISDSLRNINNICMKWNVTMVTKFIDSNQVSEKSVSDFQIRYSVAAQIKLLLNMSELIWCALENNHFSESAMLFNICRNMVIHSHLSCDTYKNGDLDIQLIFSRQWSSLQNFEDTIRIVSRNFLKSYKNNNDFEKVLDCIVSIVLLEENSLEDVLKEYLHCVEYQIQEWFSSKASIVQINIQLCSVASIIMKTISNVYELFIEGKVLNRIEELSKAIVYSMDCVKGERIYQYLPEQISKFKPGLKPYQKNCNGIAQDIIIGLTNEGLDSYRKHCQNDFTASFSHLTTIKSVGETSCELKRIFINQINNANVPHEWQKLELQNSNEWNKIIYEIYSTKLQIIINESISSLFLSWTKGIENFIETNTSLMSEEEFNEDLLFNYFWTECSKDVFFNSECSLNSNLSDVSQSENRMIFQSLYLHFSNYFDMGPLISTKNCNFESLVIKSKVIRPEIYQITKVFNEKLLQLILEIIDTINDNDDFLSATLLDCLSSIIKKCIIWIGNIPLIEDSYLQLSRNKVKKEFPYVKIESENLTSRHQLRLIILAQAVRSIYETFPALQAGLMTSAVNSELSKLIFSQDKPTLKKKSKTLRLPYLPGKKLQHQSDFEFLMWNTWNDSIESLKQSVNHFVISGIKPSINSLINNYFEHIRNSFTSLEICEYLATKWTDMNLANTETEGIAPISLEIPSQCSWLMHRLLIDISRLLTIFGGHSISRNNLDQIRLEILKTIIIEYNNVKESDEFKEKKSCQKQNIQLIFDLRFFLEIINAKTAIEKEVQDKLRSILTEIEGFVDPFDYDMMNESLHQNLIQNVAKTSSLYLLLSSNSSKRNKLPVQRIETGTNQHNLIDLVGLIGNKHSKSCVRFGMLPISGYMVPSKNTLANHSEDAPKIVESPQIVEYKNIEKSDKPIINAAGVNSYKSRSNYLGRLGSNWFL